MLGVVIAGDPLALETAGEAEGARRREKMEN